LFQNRGPKVVVRNDPESIRRSQRQQSRDGLLNHSVPAVKREQLLGALLPAQGPEARAPATGKDHRIKV
jgi:hypothetical protein